MAGFISADRIEAGTISTQKLTPLVGQELDLSENDSIERNTYIQMLPDQIVTYVGEKGYGRTFISLTDPALDPANDVHPGDYWVKQDPDLEQKTWEYCHQKTWEGVDQHVWYEFVVDPRNWGYNYYKTWGELSKDNWYALIDSVADMYCRKGTGENGEWIIVNDRSILSEAYTRITQNKDAIIQEAYRANAAEGELHSEIIQTADSITTMVERTYFTKTAATQMANELTDQAIELANNAAESAKAASIAKTTRYQSAEAIVETAVAVVDGDTSMLPEFNANTQYHKGDAVKYNGKGYLFTQDHKGAWNPNHVKEITPYIAQTTSYQTADMLHNSAVRVAGENASATYIAKSGSYTTVTAILNEAQNKADAAATSAKNASIAKTDVIQTAEYILQQAVAVVNRDMSSITAFSANTQYEIGDMVKYSDKIYQFTARHKGAWNSGHVKEIPLTYIATTTKYQTADAIVTEAVAQAASAAGTNYIQKTATYQTAESIKTEAVRVAGENASAAYIAKDGSNNSVTAILNSAATTAQTKADNAAASAKSASIAKTEAIQTAEYLLQTAIAVSNRDMSSISDFSTTTQYLIGDVVKYNSKIYRFNADHKGAWNASHVTEISAKYIEQTTTYTTASSIVSEAVRQSGNNADGKYVPTSWTKTYQDADSIVSSAVSTSAGSMAPAFSGSKSYSKGDVVSYQGKVYEFTQNKSAGNWNAGVVKETNVNESTIAQTSTNIQLYVSSNVPGIINDNVLGAITTKSGITINTSGIELTGAQYIKMVTGNLTMKGGKLSLTGGAIEMTGSSYVSIASGGYININKYSFSDENGFQWDNSTESVTIQGYMSSCEADNFYGQTIRTWMLGTLGMGLHLRSQYGYVMQYQCHEFVWWGFGAYQSAGVTDLTYGIIAMEVNHSTKQLGFTWREDYATGYQSGARGCLGSTTHPWAKGYITDIYGTIRGTSSRAIKHNITEIKSNGEVLDKLAPITFIYNDDKENVQHSGLIYEDTVGVMPEICHDDGVTKSICYVELVPYLLKEIQDLRRRVKQLEK